MIVVKSKEREMTLMDTIVTHCDQTGLEIEVSATLISPALKQMIKEEAQSMNMMKKTAKLPI
jgi:hypothetical protein